MVQMAIGPNPAIPVRVKINVLLQFGGLFEFKHTVENVSEFMKTWLTHSFTDSCS